MKAFFTHLKIQIALDTRNRGTLLTFYIIPLIFYTVMGAVFSSIQPQAKETLAASMSIFAVTMGAVLGMPPTIIKMRETGTLRAFRVSGIPGWSVLLTKALSAFINLFIVATIILLTAPLFFGAGTPADYGAFITILALVIIASIALGILIGVIAKDASSSTILSQAVFLPSLLLGGLMFPTNMLPDTLRYLGMAFPATHAMQAFTGWAFRLETINSTLTELAIMLAIFTVAALLGLIRFRRISKEI